MKEESYCSKCHAPLPADTKEALCSQCLSTRPKSGLRILCGILLLSLGALWTLFWGVAVVSSILAIDRGGGREAVGDAVGGAMMALIGLFVFVAAIFLLRPPGKLSKTHGLQDAAVNSEKRFSIKRSVIGGLIGFGVCSMVLMPVIPLLNHSPIAQHVLDNQGLVRLVLLLVLNGLPVVSAILGVIVAWRMKTGSPATWSRLWSSVGRDVMAGLIGAAGAFTTWLYLPPVLILAMLYRILGLPHTYEYLDGFNLVLVSLGMITIGAILGVIVARRMRTQQVLSPECVDGNATYSSPTTEQKLARVAHKRRPFGLILVCGGAVCLAAIFFWAHVPKAPVVLEPCVGAQPGEERTFAGIKFCWCPAGTFTMGSPDAEAGRKTNEGPQLAITFKQGFWMSKYEVTHGQWLSVEGFHPVASRGSDSLPMDMIDWHECQYFLRELNTKGDGTFRLPSEAEWEYACRAGTQTPFFFGETISNNQANLERDMPKPVGSFPGNAWNLCDMHGSVREWCQDSWHEDYTGAPNDGSPWESTGEEDRVFRSGGWDNVDRGEVDRRSASRGHVMPGTHTLELGFRIVRNP